MPNRAGQRVVIGMLTLALVLGGYAWYHSYERGRHCLEFWGEDAAVAIRYGDEVEVLALAGETADPIDALVIDGRAVGIERKRDISQERGLVHARHALIEDASFLWEKNVACEPHWDYALTFRYEDRRAVVLFDFECEIVRLIDGDRAVMLKPERLQAYRQKTGEWLAE